MGVLLRSLRLDAEAAERNLQQLVGDLAGRLVLLGSEPMNGVVDPRRHAEPQTPGAGLFATLARSAMRGIGGVVTPRAHARACTGIEIPPKPGRPLS